MHCACWMCSIHFCAGVSGSSLWQSAERGKSVVKRQGAVVLGVFVVQILGILRAGEYNAVRWSWAFLLWSKV